MIVNATVKQCLTLYMNAFSLNCTDIDGA